MIRPRAAIAAATESTRKGMSSLAMQIRIRRRPSWVPKDSIRTIGAPVVAPGRAIGDEFGRGAGVPHR